MTTNHATSSAARRPIRWTAVLSGILIALLASTWLVAPAGHQRAAAQGSSALAYGAAVTGTLSEETTLVTYTFSGTANDRVTIDVIALSGDLDPVVSLLTTRQQVLARNDNDHSQHNTLDARLMLRLPQDGTYSIIVGRASGSGEYLLKLRGQPGVNGTALRPTVLEQVTLEPGMTLLYTLDAGDCETALIAATRTRMGDGFFPFLVRVYDAAGNPVAQLAGGHLLEARVTVPPNSGRYWIDVTSADPDQGGGLMLLSGCVDALPGSGTSTALEPREAPTPVPAADTAAGEDPATTADDDTSTPEDVPTAIPAPPPDCGDFVLASPREGLPNGPATIYWNAAPDAARYVVNVYSESGQQVNSAEVMPPTTQVTLDVSTNAIGRGFFFTVEVVAFGTNGRAICTDAALQPREAPPPVTES